PVATVDGIHPHQSAEGQRPLSAGAHAVVVEYFEGGGEESLNVEMAGPDQSWQPLAMLVSNSPEPLKEQRGFQVNPDLVAEGKSLFVSAGCRSCHQYGDSNEQPHPPMNIPALTKADLSKGCLSESPGAGVPQFALTDQQRADIRKALSNSAAPPVADQEDSVRQIRSVMLALNCYACHERSSLGGVPAGHNELFTGSIPEMGDEGRIPPRLDGVGDKLQESWLREVLNKGARDRPYMATRMPRFGEENVGALVSLFVREDQKSDVAEVEFDQPLHRVTADARLMVGDQALSCIKCHYFDTHKATGIQAMDMTTMTRRLRRDWFHRYLLNPQAYRPGTRMPSAWPNNKSVVPKILNGDPAAQIEAIWLYLSAGRDAKLPSGLLAKAIELKPVDRPIIYRNFIEGLSPRGIAVGYPEHVHLAWDAEEMNLRKIWHGAFIDASLHWVGRGPGFQSPLGDHVMTLSGGQPFARLENSDAAWPTDSARKTGFRFRGYRLDSAGHPTFLLEGLGVQCSDGFLPLPGEPDAKLRRRIDLKTEQPESNLYVRIAVGDSIEERGDEWLIDKALSVAFAEGRPFVRTSQQKQELLVPVTFDPEGRFVVEYEFRW
ncbi:MAG: hypothetical protein KDA81_22085, partial [Planctomycetaceae bacterium]|nr:hypothetical protein [Planctomycetaceae bacterium]